MTDARITHIRQPPRELICVDGELDLANVAKLKIEVRSALERDPALILVDLRGCEFIDSSVIAALIELHRSLDGARSTVLAVIARGGPLRVLGLTAVDEAMPVFETMVDALQALDGAGRDGAALASTSS